MSADSDTIWKLRLENAKLLEDNVKLLLPDDTNARKVEILREMYAYYIQRSVAVTLSELFGTST